MIDAVFDSMHLENPTWRNVLDLLLDDAPTTRRWLLDSAAPNKTSVLGLSFLLSVGSDISRSMADLGDGGCKPLSVEPACLRRR